MTDNIASRFLFGFAQWRIKDFPEEGALAPKGGAPNYYLANFSRKLHENEEILGRGGARPSRPPLDPPLLPGVITDFSMVF